MATQALPRSAVRKRPAPRLRVVEGKTAARRTSTLPVVILVVLAVFGVAALQAWVGQDGLRAAALEKSVQHEQERLTLLRAQVAQLSSPHRLREEALKTGLVAVSDPAYLEVRMPVAGRAGSAMVEKIKQLESPSP